MNSNNQYSIFPKMVNDATTEPMFLGNNINVQRYDKQKYEFFDKMYEKQISFFWRPDEIDLSRDRIDFGKLSDAEKHIFTSNLKYQTLLDSIQGRSPSVAFLPLTSLPEIEEFINAWGILRGIHSRSSRTSSATCIRIRQQCWTTSWLTTQLCAAQRPSAITMMT